LRLQITSTHITQGDAMQDGNYHTFKVNSTVFTLSLSWRQLR